jgi:hypothetical protein
MPGPLSGQLSPSLVAYGHGVIAGQRERRERKARLKATLNDGGLVEERQPYPRGGAQEPLALQDVIDKMKASMVRWRAAQRAVSRECELPRLAAPSKRWLQTKACSSKTLQALSRET